MKTIMVPRYNVLLSKRVTDKIKTLLKTVNEYCVKKVVDLGLAYAAAVPDPFVAMPDVVQGSTNNLAFNKIRQFIHKALLKAMPYVKTATVPYMELPSGSSRPDCLLALNFRERPDDLSEKFYEEFEKITHHNYPLRIVHSSTTRSIASKTLAEKDSLSRYVRYLNYLFRKNKVPVQASFNLHLETPSSELDKLEGVSPNDPKVKVKFSVERKVIFHHVKWLGRPGSSLISATEKQLAKEALWTVSHPDHIHINTEGRNFCPDAHIFKHLSHGIRIINTLSRKITYGYDAFNYGVEQQG